MIAGQTVTFSTDERVRIVNPKSRDIFVRIFNRNDNINIVALPGGEFNVPANGETSYWLQDSPRDHSTDHALQGPRR